MELDLLNINEQNTQFANTNTFKFKREGNTVINLSEFERIRKNKELAPVFEFKSYYDPETRKTTNEKVLKREALDGYVSSPSFNYNNNDEYILYDPELALYDVSSKTEGGYTEDGSYTAGKTFLEVSKNISFKSRLIVVYGITSTLEADEIYKKFRKPVLSLKYAVPFDNRGNGDIELVDALLFFGLEHVLNKLQLSKWDGKNIAPIKFKNLDSLIKTIKSSNENETDGLNNNDGDQALRLDKYKNILGDDLVITQNFVNKVKGFCGSFDDFYDEFDEKMQKVGNFQRGKPTLIAAPKATGKTWYVTQQACELSKQGYKVMIMVGEFGAYSMIPKI